MLNQDNLVLYRIPTTTENVSTMGLLPDVILFPLLQENLEKALLMGVKIKRET